MRSPIFVLIVFFTLYSWGQTKPNQAPQQSGTQQLQRQLQALRAEMAVLQENAKKLEGRVTWAEYLLKQKQDVQRQISLNLAEHTYQKLDTDTGSFLVTVVDAEPYLNGYKLRLNIGNPSAAQFSGFKLTVRWAKSYDWNKYSEASYTEWQKSIQEKEFSFTNLLSTGTWNKEELIIIPASPEQLGFVTLSMSTDTVQFRLLP